MRRTNGNGRDRHSSPVRGFVGGALAGVAGAWVMNRWHDAVASGQQSQGGEDESATVKAADALSRRFAHHPLAERAKQPAGTAVHYGYAALAGGLYGAAAEALPAVSMARGVPWALGLWLFGDELAVPALHLAKPPAQVPMRTHAEALSAHLVYGLTADTLRRSVRAML